VHQNLKLCACIAGFVFIFSGMAAAYDDLVLRMIHISYGNGKSICKTARTALSPEGKMSFDEKTGILVVLERPEYLKHIEELVSAMDVKPLEVDISVLVTEVNAGFMKKAGIRSAQIIFPVGTFGVVLDMFKTRTDSFSRSEMTIKAESGEPAQLEVSKDEIFGVATVEHASGSTVTYPQRKITGDFLEVLPLVNSDSTVTVKLRPSSVSLQDDGSFLESTVLTQVTLHRGDTLALGGVDTQAQSLMAKESRKTMIFLTVR
jgi:type II secretory pathway component GspD/PulD (secretin)